MLKIILPMLFTGFLFTSLSACQSSNDSGIDSNMAVEDGKQGVIPSAQTQAMIDAFKPIYVAEVLSQQDSQQAAYEALIAADASDAPISTDIQLSNAKINRDTKQNLQESLAIDSAEVNLASPSKSVTTTVTTNVDSQAQLMSENSAANIGKTEVQKKLEEERDAKIEALPIDVANGEATEPLPLATIPIPPPHLLTKAQIENRYLDVMHDLYLPEEDLLSSQSADTLLSIATLVPELFKDEALARRLILKSPAMARLLKQYQIWEQIEAQQSIELAELKAKQVEEQEEQREKFAEMMAEFDKTIQGYDEQIAKYEALLEEFER